MRVVEEKAGERVSDIQVKEFVLHMALPRMCKALCLENRLFIMCERDEELVATLEFLTSPLRWKNGKEEVAWEMTLIARPEGYIVRLEDVKKLPVVEF